MKSYDETNKRRTNRNAAFQREQTRLHGRVNARTMDLKAPKSYGVLAGRAYGPAYRSKQGVHHFSV